MNNRPQPLDAQAVIDDLRQIASPERAAGMTRFFKTGKGEYGEGDRFLGVPAAGVWKVVKKYSSLPLSEVAKLVRNPIHEARSCALQILVAQYRKEKQKREEILRFYIGISKTCINNWDLVDGSAPGIVGEYALEHGPAVIEPFAESPILWEQRIAMISTLTLIRHGEFDTALRLARRFLSHKHDLMHKAVGWMLREVGKRNRGLLTEFLDKHIPDMPRTALRYAIEHYPPEQRKAFLSR